MLAETNTAFETQKKAITNYDAFLDSINAPNLIAETDKEATLTSSLYTPSARLSNLLHHSEHPMKTYFDLQAKLASGFINALEKHDPTDLHM